MKPLNMRIRYLKLNDNIIKNVETYRYLGDFKDNKNSLEKSIENRRNSANAVINEIKFLINQAPFKGESMEICIKLIECILIPKVLYGCETWSNIPKKQMKKLEDIQKDAVTISNGLPASTPYKGMIYECGLKPMKYRIIEKRHFYLNRILKMREKGKLNKFTMSRKDLAENIADTIK